MVFNDLHLQKADLPMLLTVSGIITLVNELHLLIVFLFFLRYLGIKKRVIKPPPAKAKISITVTLNVILPSGDVTVPGITTLVSLPV